MIEAPEARYLSEQLNRTVSGKRVTDVFTLFSPHKFAFISGTSDDYTEWLSGKKIQNVRSQGGMIELTIEDKVLVFTDGVNLRFLPAGCKLPDKHQLLLAFEDESCLVTTIRMYGGMMCFDEENASGALTEYYRIAKSKPQVMSDDFDKAYFLQLINDKENGKKSAKAFLATGQTIPGLGNGVLQDILYYARIHPKKKVASLTDKEKENLFYQIKETMDTIYRLGGRDSESDIFGKSGRYTACLSKETAGKRCPRCGECIVKETYLGGSIYYCRGCQQPG